MSEYPRPESKASCRRQVCGRGDAVPPLVQPLIHAPVEIVEQRMDRTTGSPNTSGSTPDARSSSSGVAKGVGTAPEQIGAPRADWPNDLASEFSNDMAGAPSAQARARP
jgi:hypothetical protein